MNWLRTWLRRNRLSCLVAVHTACILGILHFAIASERADRVFDRLVAATTAPNMTQEERVLSLLHKVHEIMWTTKPVFAPKSAPRAAASWHGPSDAWVAGPIHHFATGEGGCGSFTLVLAKALDRADIEFRVLQMICNGDKPGCHILLEARVDGRWVALDPLFDLSFRKDDGGLASFAEIGADWQHYQAQVPLSRRTAPSTSESFYDVHLYDYADVRGTNWNKVPVLLPAVRQLLVWVVGEERTKYISVRSWAYDINHVHLAAICFGYLMLLLTSARNWWRQRRAATPPTSEVSTADKPASA